MIKKILFLSTILFTACATHTAEQDIDKAFENIIEKMHQSNALKPKISYAKDTTFPALFYNVNTFKNGLFDKQGNSTLSPEQLTHALIAWDLNGVVFDKKYSLKENYQYTIGKYGLKRTLYLSGLFGALWMKKIYYKRNNKAEGFVWDAMFQSINDEAVYSILCELSLKSNKPDAAISTLLRELSLLGHQNVVLSNMGQGLANAQIKMLEQKISAITEKIKTAKTGESNDLTYQLNSLKYLHGFLKHEHNVIASKDNNWTHKPDRNSYENVLSNVANPDAPHGIRIFIDDKLRNIKAALADGLFDIAILYTDAESLRKIFHALRHGEGNAQLVLYAQNDLAEQAAKERFAKWKTAALKALSTQCINRNYLLPRQPTLISSPACIVFKNGICH